MSLAIDLVRGVFDLGALFLQLFELMFGNMMLGPGLVIFVADNGVMLTPAGPQDEIFLRQSVGNFFVHEGQCQV